VSQYDPNLDPTRQPNTPRAEPIYSETIVVRRESNTGWWIAGGLAALVLIAVLWILASRNPADSEAEARLAEAQAAQAQAAADSAMVQGQIVGAQQSVEMARAEAVRAQADAIRSDSEARVAEARAVTAPPPVVVTTPAPSTPAPVTGTATITSNTPQN